MSDIDPKDNCPCCSGKKFKRCCEPYLTGQSHAETPEQLMRSRYSAFALVNAEYIGATLRGAALKAFDLEDTRQWADSMEWLGLQVLNSEQQGDVGFVEFVATFKPPKEPEHRMHEKSKFKRYDGHWYYVNSVQRSDTEQKPQKLGRNDPCHCGSGKKFKKCCG
ncbi:MAG: YchJ family protein [Gammaproteobacteria bacterium]|nr:YchJ family protein [Gammaproteobacteria bacterium]MCH9744947.1 YchJ family protein [Gammaproteobacteria bacterium]